MLLNPANQLSVTRTILANERTLLSYLRFSLGSFIGGAGLIKFFGHPVYEIGGFVLVILSVVFFIVGIRRYMTTKKLISNIDPEDWVKVEGMIKQVQVNEKP